MTASPTKLARGADRVGSSDPILWGFFNVITFCILAGGCRRGSDACRLRGGTTRAASAACRVRRTAATAAASGGGDCSATAAGGSDRTSTAAASGLCVGARLLPLGRRPLRGRARSLGSGASGLSLRASALGTSSRWLALPCGRVGSRVNASLSCEHCERPALTRGVFICCDAKASA